MSDNDEQFFRTKTGICTITADRIVLSRTGLRGTAAEVVVGKSIGRVLVVYGLLGSATLAIGVSMLVQQFYVPGVLCLLFGGYLLWAVLRSRNYSATPVIERSAIRGVEAHPPRPPLTRGYFLVHFEEHGRMRKRIIMLPGSMQDGAAAYERAVRILQETGLLQ